MKKRRNYKKKTYKIILILFFIISLLLISMQYEDNILPSVSEMSENYAINAINEKINTSVEKIIDEMDLTSNDFFEKSFDNENKINYISVNSILVNKFCADVAEEITKQIKEFEEIEIELPLGNILGIEILSNLGPEIDISLDQIGSTLVDYETDFQSKGINQINFKIWLNTKNEIKVISPIFAKKIIVKRKLMLVNTVFNGATPEVYYNEENEKQ